MKLKAVVFGTDFRCNEVTQYKRFQKDSRWSGDPDDSECYLFVSRSENQLLWYLGTYEVNGRSMVDSRKWRIQNGTWNPWMLDEYAKLVGIKLSNVKSFKERYEEHIALRRSKR